MQKCEVFSQLANKSGDSQLQRHSNIVLISTDWPNNNDLKKTNQQQTTTRASTTEEDLKYIYCHQQNDEIKNKILQDDLSQDDQQSFEDEKKNQEIQKQQRWQSRYSFLMTMMEKNQHFKQNLKQNLKIRLKLFNIWFPQYKSFYKDKYDKIQQAMNEINLDQLEKNKILWKIFVSDRLNIYYYKFNRKIMQEIRKQYSKKYENRSNQIWKLNIKQIIVYLNIDI